MSNIDYRRKESSKRGMRVFAVWNSKAKVILQ
jgi:hypothetical protein